MFGPTIRGQLTIDARDSQWCARIAGFRVPLEHNQTEITFRLPGDAGEFRGHLSADSKRIVGQWIQPTPNQRYATPIQLLELSKGVWRGVLTPLDDRLSLYVLIRREADDSITAFIRNPDFNYLGRRSYHVAMTGEAVALSDVRDQSRHLEGTYDKKTDQISLRFPDLARTIDFTRRENRDAVGFFPRTTSAPYLYQQPIAEGDGWKTASLYEVGIDPKPISELIDKILTSDPVANSFDIHSLLIARQGKLVLEEYFYGSDSEQPHDMRSAAKTFGPVLLGIAIDHGAKLGPDSPLYGLFPEYKDFANPDERKNKIKLGNVTSMASGLACNDYDDASLGNEDRMQNQSEQPDWYKFTLDLPMTRDPGGKQAQYCSAGMNLIGGVVRNSSGKWIPDFFYEYLAAPLQFGSYHLNLTPTGDVYMGGGFHLRPRDELKLGQLYLSGGLWNGRRVVSSKWVDESVQTHSGFGVIIDDAVDDYGYGWHIFHTTVGGHVYQGYSAGGNGGQFVIIIPELDLVVGFNGGSYGNFPAWIRWSTRLVPQYVIPAVLSGQIR
jgi:CubicO group peptidase (beta-lactamase class C family)